MPVGFLILIVLVIGTVGFFMGRRKSLASAGGDIRKLHSLPGYYGQSVFLFAVVPAFLLMIVWLLAQPLYVENRVSGMIDSVDIQDGSSRSLVMSDVRRISSGLDMAVDQGMMSEAEIDAMSVDTTDVRARLGEVGVAVGSEIKATVFQAAKEYRGITGNLGLAMSIVVFAASLAGAAYAFSRLTPDFRARNVSERSIMALLILASSVAILTTLGIILSLLSETARFFQMYPWQDFLFNLTWNPQFRGGSDLGILPLLWGTLYVSFVALLIAVPVGLFAAIYLSEYASPRVRSIAKPMIEVLAGIPTIVYGLFALITVGPLLRDYFASAARFRQLVILGHHGGPRHGDHVDPLRFLAVRRHHQRRPTGHARRVFRPWRDPFRNHPPGDHPRRPAGHSRCHPVGRLPRHR